MIVNAIIGISSCVLTSLVWIFYMKSITVGRMVIDRSSPDKDVFRMEIHTLDVYDLPKKKKIVLKIVADDIREINSHFNGNQ